MFERGEARTVLRGLRHADAAVLVEQIEQRRQAALARLRRELQEHLQTLEPLWSALRKELNPPRYLAARDRERISERLRPHTDRVADARERLKSPHVDRFEEAARLRVFIEPLSTIARLPAQVLEKHNSRFVDNEWRRWQPFFAQCEERPLTEEQGKAAITLEENTLLVAAAGSGKTSTLVGKVAYLLAKGLAAPDEILCLAFNEKAAKEIGQRMVQRLTAMTAPECPIDADIKHRFAQWLSQGATIESRTFHSLGLDVIRQHEGRRPPVSKEQDNRQRLRRAIERCQRDPTFAGKWWLLQAVLRFPQPAESRFNSEAEYLEYLRGIWQQRGQRDGILTLGCAKPVRSFEEVAIANWLYLMGVEFEYETPFPEGAALLGPDATWLPDFTYRIRAGAGEVRIVHEHFALNADGHAPSFFNDPQGYAEQAKVKQAALSKLDARHFWTTSAQYRNGILFAKLAQCLHELGVEFRARPASEVEARLKQIGISVDDDIVGRAVSQVRLNGWDRATLEARLVRQPEPARARLFLDVAWPVAEAVNELLREDRQIDYDEMIRRALAYLKEPEAARPYRFILVDEFQDTAPGRGEMVRTLLANRPDSHLFAVGDDWQAINRFAGSDLILFNQFGPAFNRRAGGDRRCDLTQTFRTNQGIADITRQFVLKNPTQLVKDVRAQDQARMGVIDVRSYSADADLVPMVEDTLLQWVERHPVGDKPAVFVLGRYGEKRIAGLGSDQVDALNARWGDRLTLITRNKRATLYHTMHSAKGLQADYVLVVGLYRVEHDFFCFPSEREDDPLLEMVLPAKEGVTDAEERRLFYVALTRAKRQAVLLTQSKYPSPYAIELLREHRDGSVLFNGSQELPPECPHCEQGVVLVRYNPKTERTFHACSNRYGCGKAWSTWPPRPDTSGLSRRRARTGVGLRR
ncbi:UvrD-helicase domain-containing protein [Lysobacter sp. FW306-1B-D06B]|uniref:UvrD-helicase domain-containing protein n=1 Tax=Lysobacter sp. FW306-1B-D06B TaxID=3140250 RepID=UPI0031407BDE